MRRSIRTLTALAVLLLPAAAWARNPHCAGGIQYVVGSLRDKEKGNIEDYKRQLDKAIQQLNQCAGEDPKDLEAIGYLGWAYAEAESAKLAGIAFEKSIAGLTEKGDVKKVDWVKNNRDSYYARYFNAGIDKINTAQGIYADMTKPPAHEGEVTARVEALKNYAAAEANLLNAVYLRPKDGAAYKNLGLVYVFTGEYDKAEAVFRDGMAAAPEDTVIKRNLAALPSYRASRFLVLADSAFRRAQNNKGDERAAEFRRAGELYSQAVRVKPDDADAMFNAGSAYNAAGLCDSATVYLRGVLQRRADDVDAMSLLAGCLAEKGSVREAVEFLHHAVMSKPKDVALRRQLGSVYLKGGKNDKGDQERFLAVAMQLGKPVADAGVQAKTSAAKFAQSDAAKTLARLGNPEEVMLWDAEGTTYETWLYLPKKQAYSFARGTLISKSEWSAPDLAGLGNATAGGAKP